MSTHADLKSAYRASIIARGEEATDAIVAHYEPTFGSGFYLKDFGSQVLPALIHSLQLADPAAGVESTGTKSEERDRAFTAAQLARAYELSRRRRGDGPTWELIRTIAPKFDDGPFGFAEIQLTGKAEQVTAALLAPAT